ncbi:MAG: pyridoxal phosphate-dependent aminotransferase [Bdellovibrionota bacterium]
MVSLSQTMARIPPSPTIAAAAKANALKAQGKDIISFTVGEPDFDTPKHVRDAAVEALDKGLTRYTAAEGTVALRQVICDKLKRDQGVEYTPKDIVVTNGGKQALAAACAVVLNPGDEVIIPAPYWTSYPDMVRLAGGEPVIVETYAKEGYALTPEALRKACSDRTKMIIINSPSNPTGACYSGAELKALANVISSLKNKSNIVVVTDEVYEYITYDGFKHESIVTVAPELREQILIVNAFSKAYAMTGWRVGYAAGPRNIIDAMAIHQSQFTSNVCSIAQYAAGKAYDDNYAFPTMMRDEFAKRVEIVCGAVEQMPGIKLSVKPRGAFYAFLEIDGLVGKKDGNIVINSGQDFANYLLEKYDVVVVQGEAFGAPKAVRISFALRTEDLKKGLERIKQAASSLS